MKLLTALSLALLLCGCGAEVLTKKPSWQKYVPKEKKAEMAAWIVRVVEAANPHSDEEPEDNIRQAEWTANNLFGENTIGMTYYSDGFYRSWVPYEDLGVADRAACDAFTNPPAAPETKAP